MQYKKIYGQNVLVNVTCSCVREFLSVSYTASCRRQQAVYEKDKLFSITACKFCLNGWDLAALSWNARGFSFFSQTLSITENDHCSTTRMQKVKDKSRSHKAR